MFFVSKTCQNALQIHVIFIAKINIEIHYIYLNDYLVDEFWNFLSKMYTISFIFVHALDIKQ